MHFGKDLNEYCGSELAGAFPTGSLVAAGVSALQRSPIQDCRSWFRRQLSEDFCASSNSLRELLAALLLVS